MSAPIRLELHEAIALLAKTAAADPDRVYNDSDEVPCVYFRFNQPSCLVGHVLAEKGLTEEGLQDVAFTADSGAELVGDLNDAPIRAIAQTAVLEVDDQVLFLLESAQQMQDRGTPWRDTVTHALNCVLASGPPETRGAVERALAELLTPA